MSKEYLLPNTCPACGCALAAEMVRSESKPGFYDLACTKCSFRLQIAGPSQSAEGTLTKDDCLRIIELYRDWNMGQKSANRSMGGGRTEEDDLLDARRSMLKAVYSKLERLANQ